MPAQNGLCNNSRSATVAVFQRIARKYRRRAPRGCRAQSGADVASNSSTKEANQNTEQTNTTDGDPIGKPEDLRRRRCMSRFDRCVLGAILLQDFYAFERKTFNMVCPGQPFIPVRFGRALAYHSERVRCDEITRLTVYMNGHQM
jgi:hypothetical protein